MTTPLDQLLAEAIEAMNNLTKAVVERSDATQATIAMQAANDALARLSQVIELEKAAKASKEAAQLAETGAKSAKDDAVTAKNAAETAKNTAVGAANAAALSQSAAAESASTATEKANVTTAKADAAAQSAASAGQSANTATSKAQEAATNAAQVATDKDAAKASADAALASQQTAAQKATAADASAQAAQASALTAGQKEEQAKASADAAAASAQTATTKAAETVTNAGAAAQSKAAANLSEVAAAAAAAAAASSAQAATAGGIRYDTQQALSEAGKTQAKANIGLTEMLGAVNGIATLDVAGKVPASQLPSFVDDVQDFATFANLPATGEKSKIYVLETPYKLGNVTSSQFRWSGTAYAPIIASPGSTDSVTEGATNLYFTPARAQAAVTSITGNAGTASKLATPRTISATGDISYTVTFDGSGNATAQATLASTDLKAIAGLTGASGILRKTAAGTWSLDTSAYLTSITSSQVVNALGFTPISSGGSISGNAASATNAANLGGIGSGRAIMKRRGRIHASESTSLNTSIAAAEMGFTYGGSGEPVGPFITFGGLGGDIDYSCQLVGGYSGGGNVFTIRTRNDDTQTWNAWRTILTDGNYTSYSPSLTGGGASGTWTINITGNAATAGGLAVNSTGTNNGANQIVRTDGNGYANFGWINTISGDNGRGAIARIYASSDAYLRYYTPANFMAALNSSRYSREANGGTLVAGTRYSIYTGGSAISMSLPTSGAQGDEIEISNLLQTWAGNAFTVTCPSNCRINNLLESLVCNYNAGGFTLVLSYFDGSTYFWTVRT
jgi:hypothetical protein